MSLFDVMQDEMQDAIFPNTESGLSAQFPNTGMMVDPNNPNADSIASALLANQYQEWATTFKPIEQSLMQQLSFNNPSVLTNAIGTATQAATQANKTMGGVLQRQNASVGIAATPQQQAVTGRLLNINSAENMVTAKNAARENVRTQDEQILMGAIPNYQVASKSMSTGTSS